MAAQGSVEDRYLEIEEKRMKLMMEAEEHRMEVEEKCQEAD